MVLIASALCWRSCLTEAATIPCCVRTQGMPVADLLALLAPNGGACYQPPGGPPPPVSLALLASFG